jgi:outer membrane protein
MGWKTELKGRRADRGRSGLAAACVLLALAAAPSWAQEVPKSLTLDDAISLAEQNNPGFLSARNDQGPADWKAREAYAQLLPEVNGSGQMGYTAAGVQRSGTFILGSQSTDWYSSYYDLGISWSLSGSTLFGLASARAGQRATEAGIDAQRFQLASQVAQQYVAALEAQDEASVAQHEVDWAEQNLKLAETKVSAGAAAAIDAKQTRVQLGQAQVALIHARQQLADSRVMLGGQIGVRLPDSVALASRFAVFDPSWSVDSLLSLALASHPAVRAAVAKEHASVAQAREARSAYFPRLTARLDFTGYTQKALNSSYLVGQYESSFQSEHNQCEFYNAISAGLTQPLAGYPKDCSGYVLTPALRQHILATNNAFPFQFTKQPLQLSVGVSIPVFTGFSRQRQVAEASAAVDDARQSVRQERLTLRTALTQAYDALRADYQIVQIQKQNQEAAQETLEQRRKQYALGAAKITILDLLDAQRTLSTADQGYLKAVYDFHYNLIRLQAAVGRPLRPS